MPSPLPHSALVIGVGNDDRGDDGAGLAAARIIAAEEPPNCAVHFSDGETARLLDAWKNASAVYIIDAAQSGAPAGTIRRFDISAADLPSDRFFYSSTHEPGLAEAVALGRALGALPPRLIIYAIEGVDFAPGAGLSPAVRTAAQEAASGILGEMAEVRIQP